MSTEEIARLVRILQRLPMLRLGQFVSNATPSRFRGDPFYVEDDELLDEMERLARLNEEI